MECRRAPSPRPPRPRGSDAGAGRGRAGCRAQGHGSWAEATGRFRLREQDLGTVSLRCVPAGHMRARPWGTALLETTTGKCTSPRGRTQPQHVLGDVGLGMGTGLPLTAAHVGQTRQALVADTVPPSGGTARRGRSGPETSR